MNRYGARSKFAGAGVLCAAVLTVSAHAVDCKRQVLVSGLSNPVFICQAPGDNDRLFIVEYHTGNIMIYKYTTGTLNATPFITVGPLSTGGEQGLLGLAFSPNYATNGKFYVNYTNQSGNTVVAEFTVSGNPDIANPTGTTVLTFLQPEANHNGGWLGFGPDGYLYISAGDGGGADDAHGTIGNAQSRTTMLGKLLRINVGTSTVSSVQSAAWASNVATITTKAAHGLFTGQTVTIASVNPSGYNGVWRVTGAPSATTFTFATNTNPGAFVSGGTVTRNYTIPTTNPYASDATFYHEIFAFGLRNPWRCSFDRSTGDIWIGDVGQYTREEFDIIPAGSTPPLNFGWRPREGFIQNPDFPSETPVTPATNPIHDYDHSVGTCCIGGYVYRGSAIPTVQGRYFHADYGTGRVWTFVYGGGTYTNLIDRTAELNAGNPSLSNIVSFGQDNAGELYIVEHTGSISKIIPLAGALSIATASPMPSWTAGQAGYSQTLEATSGTAPYTWSLQSGSLPPAWALSTAGILSGTPTTAGTYNFTIQVQDSASTHATTSKAFSLTINAALAVTTASPLPAANVGTAYSQTFAATGGTGAKMWTISAGTVPSGITLSSAGVLSGTPTQTGPFNFTVHVADAVGANATKAMTLTVNNNLTITSTSPFPAWTRTRAYLQTLAASGGVTPYTWTVTVGTPPAGLSLSAVGVLSGTPTTTGTANFTVQVADSSGGKFSKAFALTIMDVPSISTPSPLPGGNTGTAYSQTLAVSNGTAPMTWSVSAGALPPGLALSAAGTISGTPTTAGTSNFTARVADAVGATATQAYLLTISAAPIITSTAVTAANLGTLYSYKVVATGSPAPTFSLTAFPAGMTINALSGVISWNPSVAGSFPVTVAASNGTLPNATQRFTVIVTDYGLPGRPPATPFLNMPPTEGGAIPALLSQTGVFSNTTTLTPAAALVPYNVNAPLWSDGAVKTRWIAIPTGQTIAFAAQYNWSFPAGTVLIKHFELGTDDSNPAKRKRLETRLLVVKAGGGVYGVTYHWRTDNSDADLLPDTLNEDISIATASGSRIQTWTYPSRANCLSCHTTVAGSVLGPRTNQLNGNYTYPVSGVTDNQLRTWNHIGFFNTALNEANIPGYDKLVKVTDSTATLEHRVRSYWASNCMQCHQPGSGAVPVFDARYETPLAGQHVINETLLAGEFGIDNARVVVPKDRWRSIMHFRMNSVTAGIKMPPIGHNLTDPDAVGTLESWIDSLAGTPALAPPSINPVGGSFTGSVMVSLSHPDSAATIFYTLDGSDPTAASQSYAVPFVITASRMVKARAVQSGFSTSIAAVAIFTLNTGPTTPPNITSGATPSSNPVIVGSEATFTVGASDPAGGTLSYEWNFGDGASANGATGLHAFSSPGVYTVTVTITGSGGLSSTSSVTVVVIADSSSGGGNGSIPLGMTVSKLLASTNFKSTKRDAVSLSGVIPKLPASFNPSGQSLTLNVSGATAAFTLNSRGRGLLPNGSVSLRLKLVRARGTKASFPGGDVPFMARLQHGMWAGVWGIDPNMTANGIPMKFTITIQLAGAKYQATVSARYFGKAKVSGKFKH